LFSRANYYTVIPEKGVVIGKLSCERIYETKKKKTKKEMNKKNNNSNRKIKKNMKGSWYNAYGEVVRNY
jgi:hypothetical protein